MGLGEAEAQRGLAPAQVTQSAEAESGLGPGLHPLPVNFGEDFSLSLVLPKTLKRTSPAPAKSEVPASNLQNLLLPLLPLSPLLLLVLVFGARGAVVVGAGVAVAVSSAVLFPGCQGALGHGGEGLGKSRQVPIPALAPGHIFAVASFLDPLKIWLHLE